MGCIESRIDLDLYSGSYGHTEVEGVMGSHPFSSNFSCRLRPGAALQCLRLRGTTSVCTRLYPTLAQACIARERNKGLYTADQQIEENGESPREQLYCLDVANPQDKAVALGPKNPLFVANSPSFLRHLILETSMPGLQHRQTGVHSSFCGSQE